MGHKTVGQIEHAVNAGPTGKLTEHLVNAIGPRPVADIVDVAAGSLRGWIDGTSRPSTQQRDRLELCRDVLAALRGQAGHSSTASALKEQRPELGNTSLITLMRRTDPNAARRRIGQALGFEL